jgi:hypothetical protein
MGGMNLLHPGDPLVLPLDRAIFLAGPTPRSTDVKSWRPEAVEILRLAGFDGDVLAPERMDWAVKFDYEDQVEWELRGLENCAVIAFWVPRDMATMPALTTNVEFGMFVRSRRAIYGRPHDAPHTRYLDHLYRKYARRGPHMFLKSLLAEAMLVANDPALLEEDDA